MNATQRMLLVACAAAGVSPLALAQTSPAAPSPVRADPVASATRLVTPPNAFISVTRASVTPKTIDGEPGLKVVAYVTLNHTPSIPYTFQGAVVTADGKIHTDIHGAPYVATREVQTGDEEDTDDYSVDLSLKGLFSSHAPAELYVQVRILDTDGKIVAKSGLLTFRRP